MPWSWTLQTFDIANCTTVASTLGRQKSKRRTPPDEQILGDIGPVRTGVAPFLRLLPESTRQALDDCGLNAQGSIKPGPKVGVPLDQYR